MRNGGGGGSGHGLPSAAEHVLPERRADERRSDDADVDAVPGDLEPERLEEPLDRELAGPVESVLRDAPFAGQAAEADQRALRPDQVGQGVMGGVHRAEEVDAHHPFESVETRVLEVGPQRQPRRGDRDVEPAEVLDRRL